MHMYNYAHNNINVAGACGLYQIAEMIVLWTTCAGICNCGAGHDLPV